MGDDELLPLEGIGKYVFGSTSVGLQAIAAMDTLLIMGLIDEYQEARSVVLQQLNFQEVLISGNLYCR
jgi:hypothetical protein